MGAVSSVFGCAVSLCVFWSSWAVHHELLLVEGVRDGNPEQAVGRTPSITHTQKRDLIVKGMAGKWEEWL